MSNRCFWHHKWTKWYDTERGKRVNGYGNVRGTYILQERRCMYCDKVQLRREEA